MGQGLSCFSARGIFLDQGSNPCLLHWQAGSLPLSHQGSPRSVFGSCTICPSLCQVLETDGYSKTYMAPILLNLTGSWRRWAFVKRPAQNGTRENDNFLKWEMLCKRTRMEKIPNWPPLIKPARVTHTLSYPFIKHIDRCLCSLWTDCFVQPHLSLHPLRCLLAKSQLYLFPDLLLPAALVIVITLFSGILCKLVKNECNKKKSCFSENS